MTQVCSPSSPEISELGEHNFPSCYADKEDVRARDITTLRLLSSRYEEQDGGNTVPKANKYP